MDTDELNKFIRKLNADSSKEGEETPPMELVRSEESFEPQSFSMSSDLPESSEGLQRLKGYLSEVIQRGATDLLLVPGAPPVLRCNGKLTPLKTDPLGPDDAASFLVPSLSAERRRRYAEGGVV